MPRIADRFIDNAVYIYATQDDAELGRGFGGSGFLVHVPFNATENMDKESVHQKPLPRVVVLGCVNVDSVVDEAMQRYVALCTPGAPKPCVSAWTKRWLRTYIET